MGLLWIGIGIVCLVGLYYGPPYVPTHSSDIRTLFEKFDVTGKSFVDLGAGDGRILVEAQKAGASEVVGYEINPLLFVLGLLRTRKLDSVRVRFGFWQLYHPKNIDVVYIFAGSKTSLARQLSNKFLSSEVITYGAQLSGRNIQKQIGPHTIYGPVVAPDTENNVA